MGYGYKTKDVFYVKGKENAKRKAKAERKKASVDHVIFYATKDKPRGYYTVKSYKLSKLKKK